MKGRQMILYVMLESDLMGNMIWDQYYWKSSDFCESWRLLPSAKKTGKA